MTQIKNKNIVITGAAQGIGKELAKIVLEKGAASVVLWDFDETSLHRTVNELKSQGGKVYAMVVDISDVQQIIQASEQTKEQIGNVDILINNAGILIGKYFNERSHVEIDKEMGINANGYMHVALEFLPDMLDRDSGHICCVASAAGLVDNPQMSVYCASKAAIISWAGSLRLEMKKKNKRIKITVATPNFVKTELASGVNSIVPILKKEVVAQSIIRGIERDQRFVRIQFVVFIAPFLKGILPVSWFEFLMGKVFKVYNSMDSFEGSGNKK